MSAAGVTNIAVCDIAAVADILAIAKMFTAFSFTLQGWYLSRIQ